MNETVNSPLGVCILPTAPRNAARTVSYPHYIHEILGHAGVCYMPVPYEELSDTLPHLKMLLTVGETGMSDELKAQLRSWVEAGGGWISVAGVCGMPDMFGVEVEAPSFSSWGGGMGTLGEGYLNNPYEQLHEMLSHLGVPLRYFDKSLLVRMAGIFRLHFFNGIPVKATDGRIVANVLDAHQRPTERAAIVQSKAGQGRCLLIAPDITGTVVRIQQGIAVTRDGVSSPDGTAPVCDDVLKSGDGSVLDWIFDRSPVKGVPGFSAFLQPVADMWRELLFTATTYMAWVCHVDIPLLWLYPRNLPALALLSHDTDGNEVPKAEGMLKVVKSAGINSTWCVVPPGYPKETIEQIHQAGHELAVHYDAMTDGCNWGHSEFVGQCKQLKELLGDPSPVTNKNHYLRWEGDTEFFDWCVEQGIQIDQSKGAAKTGEAGFNFGACHPYTPVAPDGRVIDMLELPTPTQDLLVFAPKELLDPLLYAARKHHGVMHLLFHPAHIEKEGVADALLEAVKKAKEQGMEWWTARKLNDWERARRQVKWESYQKTDGGISVRFHTDQALPEVTVLLPLNAKQVKVNGVERELHKFNAWGFRHKSVVFDAEANTDYTIEVSG